MDLYASTGTASTSNPRSKPLLPHPGDQLANVMSNPNIDNLFLDPTWRDPDVSMVGGPSLGVPALKTPHDMARPSSNVQDPGADDLFSQLSLSRGTSGEKLHTEQNCNVARAHVDMHCVAFHTSCTCGC